MDTSKNFPSNTGSANGGTSSTWDRTVDQASADAHKTIDKVSDVARPGVDRLASGAHQTVDKLSDAVTQAAAVLSEKASQLKDLQTQLLSDARVRVREKPVTTIAIAVAAGFLLRHLLRSR
jgi:ElaB/YqjD/DUF883 family membrane-anchored ribosome-binding protein